MGYQEQQVSFLKNKNYLREGETLDERFDAIVNVVKKYEKDYSEGLGERIRGYLEQQILCPSTPQLSNLGREGRSNTTDLPCSCNIITVPNSIAGIFYSVGETAMLSKLGAGVGADFTQICEKGTLLEEGMHSNSKLEWVEQVVKASQSVSQGSTRRGYSVPFISIDDKEFYGLMERTHKNNSNENDPLVSNNVGIILPKGFNERIKTDKELQKRFLQVLQVRKSDGKVYLVHIDNLNKNKSPVYDKLGHVVTSTNICCVGGFDFAFTSEGIRMVKTLSEENKPLKLHDGSALRNSSPMIKRSEGDALFKITLINGMTHSITKNHEILTTDGKKSIDTGLMVGDRVIVSLKKGGFGKKTIDKPISKVTPFSLLECTEKIQQEYVDYIFSKSERHYDRDNNLRYIQLICLNLGIQTRIEGSYITKSNKLSDFVIAAIDFLGKNETYCPTVDSEDHLWVCNGFITSNSEAVTPHYDDKTFCCMLTSLNLVHWDKIKEDKQIIKDAFMFLDITVSEYIRLTENIPFLEKARRSAIEKRDIGLGTLGFHDYIQSKGSAYGDLISRRLNREIFKTIREAGEEVTKEMAEKLGSPKMCEDAGMVRRNVSLMMVAPNKSCMTLETNLLGENDHVMNFYELTEKGGIDINEQLEVTIVYEDGTEHTCHYNDTIDGVKVSDLILENTLEEV